MINLPNVTLFAIDRHDKPGITRAVDICAKDIHFGRVVLITEHDMFEGREQYSKFMIQRLSSFVKTDHVLTVHSDGYIQNPSAWDDSWLEYDYIGAPWPWYKEHMVGNGGFSLRSKKLLDILARTDLTEFHPEDQIICQNLRPWLEKEFGIKFAPYEVARKFSIEGYGLAPQLNIYDGEFGFHGKHVRGLNIPMPSAQVKFGQTYVKHKRLR